MISTCKHLTPEFISAVADDKLVYKDECTQCFGTDVLPSVTA